jgi:hypothetical protein
MKVKLGRMLVLAGASLTMLIASSAPASAASTCLPILGAGSSLQKIAQENVWISGFTKASGGWWEGLCEADTEITYMSTSSGKGKTQWGYENGTLGTDSPFEAFIGTDLAPNDTQLTNMGAAGEQPTHLDGVVTVPVAQSAVSVIVSLPLGCKPVNSTEPAEIKSAKILTEEWETGGKEFSTYVKGLEGTCTADPNLKVRSSNSGTTAGFKRFFATLTNAEPWLKLTETPLKSEEPTWPMTLELSGHFSACCEKGSTLAETVYTSPGLSGYADLADARNEGFAAGSKWASHTNAAGESYWSAVAEVQTTEEVSEFVSPEETGGGSNCKNAKYKEETVHSVGPGEDWSEVKQSNVKKNASYPICTLTFDLAWNHYSTPILETKYGSALKAEHVGLTVLHYLHTIISTTLGQGGGLTTAHYGALPTEIQTKALNGVTETNIVP